MKTSQSNRAAEIRVLAERQMGEFLKAMPKNEGAKGTGSNQHEVRSREGTAPATLAEIGLTKKQSATAQKLAAIPKEEFQARVLSGVPLRHGITENVDHSLRRAEGSQIPPAVLQEAKGIILASSIAGFANGVANLRGPGTATSDSILARLSAGESVLTARTTAFLGEGLINALNTDPAAALARPYVPPSGGGAGGFGAGGDTGGVSIVVLADPAKFSRMMVEDINSRSYFFDLMNEFQRKT